MKKRSPFRLPVSARRLDVKVPKPGTVETGAPKATDKEAGLLAIFGQNTGSERTGGQRLDQMDFVIDMQEVKIGNCAGGSADAATGDAALGLIVLKSDYRTMISPLLMASRHGELDVTFDPEVPDGTGRQSVGLPYKVKVLHTHDKSATKRFRRFEIFVRRLGNVTRLTLEFSRDQLSHPTSYSLSMRANPTTIWSAQNAWPVAAVTGNIPHDLALLMSAPFRFVLTVCKAADNDFRPPAALVRAILQGQARVINAQFAINVPTPSQAKPVALALLDMMYSARRFVAAEDGAQLSSRALGDRFRIMSDLFTIKSGPNVGAPESVLLRKSSGDHAVASICLYDKCCKLNLHRSDAEHKGLWDTLRLDVTLQVRGLEKLMAAAAKLAKDHGVENELAKTPRNRYALTMVNLICAVTLIEALYVVPGPDGGARGFSAWLLDDIGNGEFYVAEAFGIRPEGMRAFKRHVLKLAEKNDRYRNGWDRWSGDAHGAGDFNLCFLEAGLTPSQINRLRTKARKLGVSTKLPPSYVLDREATWLLQGLKNSEVERVTRNIRKGKPISATTARGERRMREAIANTQCMLSPSTPRPLLVSHSKSRGLYQPPSTDTAHA